MLFRANIFGVDLKVIRVAFERCVGNPVILQIETSHFASEEKLLSRKACCSSSGRLTLSCDEFELLPDHLRWRPVGRPTNVGQGQVTGAVWRFEVPHPPDQDGYPLWRVHRVESLEELMDSLREKVGPMGPLLRPVLRQLKFDKKTSVLQAGLTDWDFAQACLNELVYNRFASCMLADGEKGGRGIWTGSLATEMKTGWTRGTGQNDTPPSGSLATEMKTGWTCERCDANSPASQTEIEVPAYATEGCSDTVRMANGAWQACRVLTWKRHFSMDKWTESRELTLPAATKVSGDTGQVWRLEDSLEHFGGSEVYWTTRAYVVSTGTGFATNGNGPSFRLWKGQGVVQKNDAKGGWLDVKLGGFEPGYDVLPARLVTLYSGKDGKRGVHLVPEVNTEVFVEWGGYFGAPCTVHDNLRPSEFEAIWPSPCYDFEHPFRIECEDTIDFHAVKDLSVKSDGQTYFGRGPGG